ncbi:hypothetical protein B0H63DRAFT_49083 [Podospora didyma]|uniref:Uncharacterized protein n=1 Tax=Podospora didyma TaxID=330526 RepID=A0AAE0P707_9PEZI|nr:hypothetical protein B0H63DRAFT_49083 [Podospora didyma]
MGDDAPERAAKGKGRATADKEDNVQQENASSSLSALSRLAQSASSLPTALFSGPAAAEGLSSLGSSSREKGGTPQTSSEGASRAGEGSAQMRSSLPGSGESLRPNQTQQHIAQEDASFAAFLDSTPVQIPTEAAWQSTSSQSTGLSSATSIAHQPPQTVTEQQAHDGSDVVALLLADGVLEADFSPEETISPEAMSKLRNALFGESVRSVAWDNVLNFIPPYLASTGDKREANERQAHLGTANGQDAWQMWTAQWSEVLASYQDEVWGDLGALVKDARLEVLQLEDTPQDRRPPEPTALLRLRAILNHLRSS